MIEALIENDVIVCPVGKDMGKFNRLRDSIDPRRKWSGSRRAWVFPNEPIVRSALGLDAPAPPPAPKIIDFAWPGSSKPFEHQLDGASRLLNNDAYLLAWEPGVGKTAPTCAALALLKDRKRTLIVCPRCVLPVWPRELELHGKLSCIILDGTPTKRTAILKNVPPDAIVVATYEIVRQEEKALAKLSFENFVLDECHRVKSSTTQTSRAIRRLSKSSKRRWCLSGTPAPNSPLDWFGTLIFLGEEHAGTTYWTRFRDRYAVYGAEVAPGIRKVVSFRDLDDLNARVAKISHRLRKEDCLDLPEKIFESLPITLSPKARKIYDTIRKEAIAKLESGETITAANVLTEAMRLVQIAGGWVKTDGGEIQAVDHNAKLATLVDFLEDVVDPVIVWCSFKHEAKAIAAAIKDRPTFLHHGELGNSDRADVVDAFRKSPNGVLISTTPSLREGVTLVNSATMVYYSRNYSLTDWLQSQDRTHRIGQLRSVRCVSLIAANTVDEKIAKALSDKREIQELLLQGVEAIL